MTTNILTSATTQYRSMRVYGGTYIPFLRYFTRRLPLECPRYPSERRLGPKGSFREAAKGNTSAPIRQPLNNRTPFASSTARSLVNILSYAGFTLQLRTVCCPSYPPLLSFPESQNFVHMDNMRHPQRSRSHFLSDVIMVTFIILILSNGRKPKLNPVFVLATEMALAVIPQCPSQITLMSVNPSLRDKKPVQEVLNK